MPRRPAAIVDVDDTLCDVSEIRHLYAVPDNFREFTEASLRCPPRQEVQAWCIRQFHESGRALLVVTGRSDEFRGITSDWLAEHLSVPYAGLWMRSRGDYRSNVMVKRDIHVELAQVFDVRAAIDDDPTIAQMWALLGISSTLIEPSDERLI